MDRRSFLIGGTALPAFSSTVHDALPAPPTRIDDEKYWHELRWHFSIPRGEAYCNTATLGASPKSVVNAVADHMRYAERMLSSVEYGVGKPHFLGGYQPEPALRRRIGEMIGCSGAEVALTRNATMGMSFIAQGLQLEKGDQIVMSDQEHPGGRAGYDVRVKRDGIEIVEVQLPRPANDPDKLVELFAAAITKRTAVLALPHITSANGIVLPIKAIVAAARAKQPDIYVVIDGAQSLGQVPVDVIDLDCDAYFSSPHKWVLSPKGTGILYVRKSTNTRVWTTIACGHWDFGSEVGRRFTHMGTGNQSLYKGFEAALDFLDRIGIDVVHARIKALGDRLRAGLKKIPGVKIASSTHPEMCAGITTYSIPGWDPKAATRHMYKTAKIMPRALGQEIRQSLHIYTTFADVDRTLACVKKMATR